MELSILGFVAAVVVMYFGYRLGPYVFDGFIARQYEELFRPSDIWDIDRSFERVMLEFAADSA
jgi:hypothetical protein